MIVTKKTELNNIAPSRSYCINKSMKYMNVHCTMREVSIILQTLESYGNIDIVETFIIIWKLFLGDVFRYIRLLSHKPYITLRPKNLELQKFGFQKIGHRNFGQKMLTFLVYHNFSQL